MAWTGKKLRRKMTDIGLTKENGKVLATCAAGLGLYGIAVTTLDEAAKVFTPSEAEYKAFTKTMYGSTTGKVVSTLGCLISIAALQNYAIDENYIAKGAKRKARAAAVGFAGASLLSRLDTDYQISQRFDYLSAGSLPAAFNPNGSDAQLLNAALV